MGSVLSQPQAISSSQYTVHDIHYWPGKVTPPRLWSTLLPDYHKNKSTNITHNRTPGNIDGKVNNGEKFTGNCGDNLAERHTIDQMNKETHYNNPTHMHETEGDNTYNRGCNFNNQPKQFHNSSRTQKQESGMKEEMDFENTTHEMRQSVDKRDNNFNSEQMLSRNPKILLNNSETKNRFQGNFGSETLKIHHVQEFQGNSGSETLKIHLAQGESFTDCSLQSYDTSASVENKDIHTRTSTDQDSNHNWYENQAHQQQQEPQCPLKNNNCENKQTNHRLEFSESVKCDKQFPSNSDNKEIDYLTSSELSDVVVENNMLIDNNTSCMACDMGDHILTDKHTSDMTSHDHSEILVGDNNSHYRRSGIPNTRQHVQNPKSGIGTKKKIGGNPKNSSFVSTSTISPGISNSQYTEEEWLHRSYPFENIALSGGGMKAYSYIGAIKALEDAGIMPNIKRFAGASSGAMCAASLALGYTAQEICTCFFVDLTEVLNDQRCPCILCVPKLYRRFGVHPAKRFLVWYGKQIAAKTGGNQNITFKEHYDQFGKELCIVVSNITKMAIEYGHYTTTPDLSILSAVRMSIAIPVVYEPVKIEIDGQINYYIDGGIGDHFPIHCYDGATVGPNLTEPINDKTIGFYVLSEKDSEHVLWRNIFGKEIPNKPTYMPDTKLARCQLQDEIKRRKKSQKNFDEKKFMDQLEKFSRMSMETLAMRHYETLNKTHVDTSNILAFIVNNIETMINVQVVRKMKPKDEDRTIPINVGYMETHLYQVEPADREFLIKQGYASTKAFLQQHKSTKGN